MQLKIKKLNPAATLPSYAREGDAGLDLFAVKAMVIEPGKSALVPTGIAIELPSGTEAQVRPRSGLALKHAITVLNTPGTVDEGYRGEVGVIRQPEAILASVPGGLAHALNIAFGMTWEITWALILDVTRRLSEGDRLVRAGKWTGWTFEFMLGAGLQGQVVLRE